jgi:hypothetical protein
MSTFALICGRLPGEPVTRPTKTGGQVTFFKLRLATNSAAQFWNVMKWYGTVAGRTRPASLFLDDANEEFREALRNSNLAMVRKALDAVRVHSGSVTHSIENLTRSLQ